MPKQSRTEEADKYFKANISLKIGRDNVIFNLSDHVRWLLSDKKEFDINNAVLLGTAYYPEDCDEAEQDRDIAMM